MCKGECAVSQVSIAAWPALLKAKKVAMQTHFRANDFANVLLGVCSQWNLDLGTVSRASRLSSHQADSASNLKDDGGGGGGGGGWWRRSRWRWLWRLWRCVAVVAVGGWRMRWQLVLTVTVLCVPSVRCPSSFGRLLANLGRDTMSALRARGRRWAQPGAKATPPAVTAVLGCLPCRERLLPQPFFCSSQVAP